jgi:hypothetical protein
MSPQRQARRSAPRRERLRSRARRLPVCSQPGQAARRRHVALALAPAATHPGRPAAQSPGRPRPQGRGRGKGTQHLGPRHLHAQGQPPDRAAPPAQDHRGPPPARPPTRPPAWGRPQTLRSCSRADLARQGAWPRGASGPQAGPPLGWRVRCLPLAGRASALPAAVAPAAAAAGHTPCTHLANTPPPPIFRAALACFGAWHVAPGRGARDQSRHAARRAVVDCRTCSLQVEHVVAPDACAREHKWSAMTLRAGQPAPDGCA